MQFGFTPERGTIDAVFIFRSLQKEYHANGRNYVCFVDLEKAFDRAQRSVGVGNEEERNSRNFCWISDESVRGSKGKGLRLKWGCIEYLCCLLFFLQMW